MDINWKALAAPIPKKFVKQRKQGNMMVDYITSRTVMNRLDSVVTPANWRDEYEVTSLGLQCTLYIRAGDEWIGKSDIGQESNYEGEKGAYSDALKRAAIKWGIGRELYGEGTAFENMPDSPQNQRVVEVQGLTLDVEAALPDASPYPAPLINALHSLSGFSEESLTAWLQKNGIDADVPNTDAFALFEMRLIDNYEADTDYLLDGDRSFLKAIEGRTSPVLLPFETYANVNALAATFSGKADAANASKPQIEKMTGLFKELFTFYEDDPAQDAFWGITGFLFPGGGKLLKSQYRAMLGWLQSADGFYPAAAEEGSLILAHLNDKERMMEQ